MVGLVVGGSEGVIDAEAMSTFTILAGALLEKGRTYKATSPQSLLP